MLQAKVSVTILSGAAVSEAINLEDLGGDAGLVGVPGAWTSASLGFQVSDAFGGTYSPLRDQTGAVVEISNIQTAAAGWYKLPDALRGAMYVKLWSESSGSDAVQGADRAMVVLAKG